MKLFKETNNYGFWSLLKDDFRSLAFKHKNGFYQNEELTCLFQYVISKEPTTEKYKMHFSEKPEKIFLYNRQFLTLRSTSPNLAKEWLIHNYEFYKNEKNRYLDYFEDGIIGYIANLKLSATQTVSLNSCLEWIRLERENLKQEKQNEEKNKTKDLTQKNELLLSAIEKLENEKKILEETLFAERKINRDLEIKTIELNVSYKAKLAEIEILNNSNLTFSSLLDPKNSKLPKITLPKNSYEIKIKLIQCIDLLNVGNLGILEFQNDKAFARFLKIIDNYKDIEESTLVTDINKARNRHKEGFDKISEELIKWLKVHFEI